MGKMKVSKNNRRAGKSGSPNWVLSTIVAVVIVAVLLSCVATLVSTSGIVMRWSTAMKSEDYKVSGNMMAYFYVNTYTNFAQNYESYMNYFSIGAANGISDHREITIGGTKEKPNSYDTMFLGDFKGTWFDYFMKQTQDSVKSMLIYCEEADKLGITLTDEDKKNIEATIDSKITEFKIYNLSGGGGADLSEATCLKALYGEGVKRSDVRKALELSTLASKCSEKIYETIEGAVTEDRINKEYADDQLDYDMIDYFYYRFSVNYEDVAKEVLGENYKEADLKAKEAEVLAKYKEKIEETKKLAEELEKITVLADFQKYVLNYAADKSYDSLLADEKLKSEDLPAEADLKTIKSTMIANVIKDVLDGKTETTEDVKTVKATDAKSTIYDIEITETFAKAAKDIKKDLFTSVSNTKKSYTVEGGSYAKDDDFSKWAFEKDRKAGDIKNLTEGDGSKGDVKVDKKYFRDTVYFVTKAQYRNDAASRDVAYMMFSSSDTAKKAIEALKKVEGLDSEKFLAKATELGAAASTLFEDYVKGDMQSTTFDNWLYAADTKIGTLTQTPLTMSDGSLMVAFYAADGEPSWKVVVKNTLIEEDYTAREDAMTAAHSGSVEANDWVIGRVHK